jgi:aminoglycoside 6'-N-acetyltransferase I
MLDQVEGGVTLAIRPMGPADHPLWADLAHALWPETARDEHFREIAAMAGPGIGGRRGWLAERDGAALGFAELGLRPYANGCHSQPVAFLEAIWVAPQARRRGIGRALLAHLEAVVRAEGGGELGSDALIENHASHAAHRAWGFEETERVVYFRKALG